MARQVVRNADGLYDVPAWGTTGAPSADDNRNRLERTRKISPGTIATSENAGDSLLEVRGRPVAERQS